MNITISKIKQWIVERMLACNTVFDRTTPSVASEQWIDGTMDLMALEIWNEGSPKLDVRSSGKREQ
ncbi:MAG: hypothetical protein AB9903_07480 [Vulcanimicrobiota bacterium]